MAQKHIRVSDIINNQENANRKHSSMPLCAYQTGKHYRVILSSMARVWGDGSKSPAVGAQSVTASLEDGVDDPVLTG